MPKPLEWKDTTSYSRLSLDRAPRTFEAYAGPIRLIVTRHLNYPPDTWVGKIGQVSETDLRTDDPEHAKELLVCMLGQWLDQVAQSMGWSLDREGDDDSS